MSSTTIDEVPREARGSSDVATHLGLVIAWSGAEPDRAGQIALVADREPCTLGRGDGEDGERRLRFFMQRPGQWRATPSLANPALSRRQLVVRAVGGELAIERVGRCPLSVNDRDVDRATLGHGDVARLGDQLVLVCVERAASMSRCTHYPMASAPAFGRPDAVGIVGESAAAWALREQAALAARASGHVLVTGPSGSGKELVARTIHALSAAADKPLVARNAATLPAGLVDAELFGNLANYPNAGMPARAGLVGEADGSTLLLDEIGELSHEMQGHLLRVLDRGGEYQRLGESKSRRSAFRLVGVTNRSTDDLKHDLAARLTLRLHVPGLDERPEDVPLVAAEILRAAAASSPEVAGRFVSDGNVRMRPALVARLVRHPFTHHVRELSTILWASISSSATDELDVPPSLGPLPDEAPRVEPTADEIRAALDRHDQNQSRASRELGLKNRYVLIRLMKKHGIAAERGKLEA